MPGERGGSATRRSRPDELTETLESGPPAPHASEARVRLWGHMQRIELYRHRADLAEREAASEGAPFRDGLLRIASAWRELAAEAERLAAQARSEA